MGNLCEQDKKFLLELREFGVLEEVEPSSMDLVDGVIAILCGDGDQFFDVYGHIAGICKGKIGRERIHPLSLNGGALTISGRWPTPEEAVVYKRHVLQTRDPRVKGIKTVVLYGHAPCGAAGLCCLSIRQTIEYLVEAKGLIKNLGHDLKVMCFFHVDWEGDGSKKRTYFLSRDKWNEYVALHPHQECGSAHATPPA